MTLPKVMDSMKINHKVLREPDVVCCKTAVLAVVMGNELQTLAIDRRVCFYRPVCSAKGWLDRNLNRPHQIFHIFPSVYQLSVRLSYKINRVLYMKEKY
jgi:hypothetical protein